MVRALNYCSEDRGSGPTWNYWLEARSLSTQQQIGPGGNTGEIKAELATLSHNADGPG